MKNSEESQGELHLSYRSKPGFERLPNEIFHITSVITKA
jgi:hypothetical protein